MLPFFLLQSQQTLFINEWKLVLLLHRLHYWHLYKISVCVRYNVISFKDTGYVLKHHQREVWHLLRTKKGLWCPWNWPFGLYIVFIWQTLLSEATYNFSLPTSGAIRGSVRCSRTLWHPDRSWRGLNHQSYDYWPSRTTNWQIIIWRTDFFQPFYKVTLCLCIKSDLASFTTTFIKTCYHSLIKILGHGLDCEDIMFSCRQYITKSRIFIPACQQYSPV